MHANIYAIIAIILLIIVGIYVYRKYFKRSTTESYKKGEYREKLFK